MSARRPRTGGRSQSDEALKAPAWFWRALPKTASQHTPSPLTFQHTIQIDRYPALGWFVMEWRGRRLLVHEGQDDGFTSMLLLEPAARNAIVLMVNKRDDDSSLALWNLTLEILARLPQ